MTAAPTGTNDARRVRRALVAAVLLGAALAAIAYLLLRDEAPGLGPTVGEKVAAAAAERASLQARADGEARIGLLPAFRTASLLTDALAARSEADGERAFDGLPPVPASGLRRDRRAERRAQGCPGATGRRARGLRRSRQPSGDGTGRGSMRRWPSRRASCRRAGAAILSSHGRAAAPPRRYAGRRRAAHDQPSAAGALRAGLRRRRATRIRRCRSRSSAALAPAAAAAGAGGRCLARRRQSRRAAALCRAARGLRHRRRSAPLFATGDAVSARRRPDCHVPAPVHRAARPPRIVRLRSAGAHDDARSRTPWCRRRSCRGRRPARRARCAAASIRRPAGVSIRSAGAWSSSSGWAGRTTSAIRR